MNQKSTGICRRLLHGAAPCMVMLLAGLVTLAPSDASADEPYRIIVLRGTAYDVEEQTARDIVEESAFLVEDFGGFEVLRDDQLGEVVDSRARRYIRRCEEDIDCYIEHLYGSGLDYTLVVQIDREGGEIRVRYQMIDIEVGILKTEQTAYMPDPLAFDYLLVPCHEALKVTPAWLDEGPIESEVVVTEQPDPPPPGATPSPDPSEVTDAGPPPVRSAHRSMFEKIGVYTLIGGGVLLGGGVVMGFSADDTQQEIQAQPHDRETLESLQSDGERQRMLANTLYGVGGAALVGGVTMMILGKRGIGPGQDDDVALDVSPRRGGLDVRASFRF